MKLKTKRAILSTAFIGTITGVPLGVFTYRYELWELSDSRKLSLFTVLLLTGALISSRRFIYSRIKALNYGATKTILVSAGALIPTALIYSLSWFVAEYSDIFLEVVEVFAITQAVAWTTMYPFIMNMDHNISKQIRKEEMIEAIKAAGGTKDDEQTVL